MSKNLQNYDMTNIWYTSNDTDVSHVKENTLKEKEDEVEIISENVSVLLFC